MTYIYILQNTTGMTYVGVSKHPLSRLTQHNSAAPSSQRHYTNRNRPWRIAAVFQGFTTRAQALRAEYIIKHRPWRVRHPVAIVSRIATARATCEQLLRTDNKFRTITRLSVVVWDVSVHHTVQTLVHRRPTSTAPTVAVRYLG